MNTMPQREQALRARRVSARWLVLARAAWMVSAVLALGILLASLPDYLGMGTGPGPHPFMDVPSETSAALDIENCTFGRRYC